MRLVWFFHLCILKISTTNAWYTGPDGNIAVEGTPEHAANRYLKKIFIKYGVDLELNDEMGQKMLRELMTNLGLGVIHKLPNIESESDNDHDDHGERRRKRRSSQKPRDVNKFADSVSPIPHSHKNITIDSNDTDCRSGPLLLREYQLDEDVTEDKGIGSYEFGMLCPALIYLTDEKTCIEHEDDETESPDTAAIWGYGFLSVTVISLLSLLGVVIVPLISASYFETMLSVLVAGAVGALCGDALLHLIPHSQASSHAHTKEPIFKNLVVLLGIYLLFVIEGIMKIIHLRKQRIKQGKHADATLKSPQGDNDEKGGENDCAYIEMDTESREHHAVAEPQNHAKHAHSHGHDHGDLKDKGIASMAWMVIAGDGMHNFSDGIAIGAAFSADIVGGLSTSIAIFCHELPHELGDFAMLVKSGMSVKQALFYNAFASCLAYLGLVMGIMIGNYAASVTSWIFAITAGMFLYVALVDMLPEVSACMAKMKTKSIVITFLLQNLGLLIGIGIMLIISLFEEKLEFGG